MSEFLVTLATALTSSGVTGFFTWLFARRKYNSEVDSQVINNMKESLDFYKALTDYSKERIDEVLKQNKEILKQNSELLIQNAELKAEVGELKLQIENILNKDKKE